MTFAACLNCVFNQEKACDCEIFANLRMPSFQALAPRTRTTHLDQSTLVLGCGNITYTEEDPGGSGFTMSGGHRMKGGG